MKKNILVLAIGLFISATTLIAQGHKDGRGHDKGQGHKGNPAMCDSITKKWRPTLHKHSSEHHRRAKKSNRCDSQ